MQWTRQNIKIKRRAHQRAGLLSLSARQPHVDVYLLSVAGSNRDADLRCVYAFGASQHLRLGDNAGLVKGDRGADIYYRPNEHDNERRHGSPTHLRTLARE